MDFSLLNKKEYKLDDKISVIIPTLKEIRGKGLIDGSDDDENDYYNILNLFFITPSSCIPMLEKLKIDFTTISDFELFLLMYNAIDKNIIKRKSKLLFKGFNFADFKISKNNETGKVVLYNSIDDVEINETKYKWLSTIFCTIHLYTKPRPINPANQTAKDWIIERAMVKEKFNRKKKQIGSRFDNLILALVNNSNFKYNFETVYDLTVYNFYASAKQIIKKYQVDNLYHGIYSGCIDSSKINNDSLNWLSFDYSVIAKKESIKK